MDEVDVRILILAVASTEGNLVDLHFGDAYQFFIFEIKEGESQFKELRKKSDIPIQNHKDRCVGSLEIVEYCKTVICSRIGREPALELRKRGIKVIQVESKVKYAVEQCSQHMIN